MTGLPTFTVWAPYGSLIAARIKTAETRTGPPAGDMCPPGARPEPGLRINRGARVAVHQGKQWAPGWRDWLLEDDWRCNTLDSLGADLLADVNGSEWCRVDRCSLPLGALVATAELVDVAPIGGPYSFRTGIYDGDEGDYPGQPVVVRHPVLGTFPESLILSNADTSVTDITDQLPYGDFTPGRWAWLLDDVKPTTERCPLCWGDGLRRAFTDSDQPSRWGGHTHPCPVCDGAGHCPPIPAKGRQGVWRWAP